VVTYTSNTNTSDVVKELVSGEEGKLRIVLETDAPYMVPSNLYDAVPEIKGKRFPVCHTAMVPWTAQFVSDAITKAGTAPDSWSADRIMEEARENARHLYGV